MLAADPLEITITHNLDDAAEVLELFRQRLIALDWGRKGPDPNDYTGRAKTDVKLFNEMRTRGAAVIAAYKGATEMRSHRLIGWIEPGSNFVRFNDLLCLKLTKERVIDSASGFFGNLPPRQCTVQLCSKRARGRLNASVLGKELGRDINLLHHREVELLVTNYLMMSGMCQSVWHGTRTYEDIDHAGLTADGHELLAQTTISPNKVSEKAKYLIQLANADRVLYLFGPQEAASQCLKGINYLSIEEVFAYLEKSPAGQWLINRMLPQIAN
ncbi:MAG TPA: hypothetical protein VI913_05440 [Candidatus Peribacteraceae bacterium]|nr:hypothetical protein [Candidatus Peribacteraceae bacterium]